MTFLRDERRLRPTQPVFDENGVKQGMVHYQAIIEGRNLRYQARYPANSLGKVQKTGQICLAASLKPGTG